MAPEASNVTAYERLQVEPIAERLAASRRRLSSLSSLDVCRFLGEVHAEWAEPKSRRRVEAVQLLSKTTGYARAAIDRSLRHLFGTLTETALREWLGVSQAEGPELLGPPMVGFIAAGNLPGTAIPSLVQALLLRSTCLLKSSSAEPHLMPLYTDSIASGCPELGHSIAVMCWSREDEDSTAALLRASDALIAYGTDATLASLRQRFAASRPFVGYGHRVSFSVVGRQALSHGRASVTARKVALDLAVFDQQGCLSPQAIYLERGGEVSPTAFAAQLAEELELLRTHMPRRSLSPEESSAIHQFRAEFEMRSLAWKGAKLWHSERGTAWTVALQAGLALEPCPLNRTALLYPFDTYSEVVESAAALQGHLISCGMAVSARQESMLRGPLAELGVTRFCRLGEAQFPTAEEILLHDGLNPLRVLGKEHTSPARTGAEGEA